MKKKQQTKRNQQAKPQDWNETLARKVQERFRISNKTVKDWKKRGYIPAMYFDVKGAIKKELPTLNFRKPTLKWNAARAAAIQKEYGLSDVTVRNWKWNGHIPAQYRKGTPRLEYVDEKSKAIVYRWLNISWLRYNKLGINPNIITYFKQTKGRGRLEKIATQTAFDKIKALDQKLQAVARKPDRKNIASLIADPLIKISHFFDNPTLIAQYNYGTPLAKKDLQILKQRAKDWSKAIKF